MRIIIACFIIFILGYHLGFKQNATNGENQKAVDDTIIDDKIGEAHSESLSFNHTSYNKDTEDSIDGNKEYDIYSFVKGFYNSKE